MLAVGIALTRLLESAGVKPAVVVGHSLGEFTAACVGGVFSAADAAKFVAARGRAMANLEGDHGTMAALMADRETAEPLLVDGAILANFNHPRQLVVSGFTDAITQVIANAEAAGVKAVRLPVSHGFHSPALANLDSSHLLDGVALHDPSMPIASGIHDGLYTDSDNARDIFMRHATSPVEFVRALHQCRDAGADLYLQVGAGGPLASFARGALPRDHKGVLTLAGKRDDDGGRSILQTLGQLWTLGVNIDVSAINQAALPSSLPPTVLPREPYWVIKDEPQLPLELKGIKPRKRAPAKVTQEQIEAVDSQSDDPIADKVIGIISKVSAYPRSALRPEMSLIDDLGFDSLMVGDLATGLSESFAAIDGIPQELLINQPTVLDIIDFAKNAREGATVQSWDDDAPLVGFALGWTDAEHPDLPGRDLPAGLRVLLVDGSDAMAAAFEGDGAEVMRLDSAAATSAPVVDLVVWNALAPNDDWDLAAPFIAALAHQASNDSQPDVLVLSRDGDPWAAGLHGVVRGLTREWPGCSATSLHLSTDNLDQAGELARLQWMSSDRSADVRHSGDVRQVTSHLPQAHAPTFELKGARVLITGGTRGIGADVAQRLIEEGSNVVLMGRSAPGETAKALLDANPDSAVCVLADVTNADQLAQAVRDVGPIDAIVHCAGVLADGALQDVDSGKGKLARAVKAQGLLNAVAAAGPTLKVAVGIGSWAGRYGNRHQAHYGAANALLASLCDDLPEGVRGVTAEFGPWSSSDMVATIPAPVQSAMRAEGVDFVGDKAGLQTLIDCLTGHTGILTMGRDLPRTGRAAETTITLSTTTHPYLLDHAIQDVPVLPLAGAADLLAWAVGAKAPFELSDLRLFQGVTVQEPVQIKLIARGDRVELRQGPRMALAYKCRVRPFEGTIDEPTDLADGKAAELSLRSFYDDVTFHGPLLQGIESIDAVADDNVRGLVRAGTPIEWIPASSRQAWAIDPLVLDSAMQLSGYVAWIRYQRAGTPVAMGRYVQLAAFEPGSKLNVQVTYGDSEGDKFSGDLWLRNDRGELLAVALNVVAELRETEKQEEQEEQEPPFVVKKEWLNFSKLKELVELENRLAMAQMGGIRNPYFRVQEGTARDTTVIEGDEYINYSSYNYIGLSGDPRVVDDVKVAVERYGTSVSASRVASGERAFHGVLEKELAVCQRSDDAIVFTAGHATNVTTIGHLFGPDDLIMHDEYIHDSGLQGIKLSGANRRMFRHDDPKHLDEQLTKLRRHYQRCLILVEGVYSMDGDICNLPAYIELKRKHGCMVMVDEAHSFGIIGKTGRGVSEYFDLKKGDVDLYMGTLSKSLSSCGGWIAADQRLITYLKYTAPGFIYSAGLTAANGVAALSSLRLMLAEPWRVKKLQHNAQFFHAALTERNIDTGPADGESGVIPAVTGNSMHALQLSQRLNDAHINVQPIVYPAVPDDAARLRFFLSSTHSEHQLTKTADLVSDILTQVRADFPLPKRR
ncbi:MAG: 8-amino-7-oxononanoate synthase [Kiritimatiellia bacterium]|jgi:8-amino-7-oxononanoate synthase